MHYPGRVIMVNSAAKAKSALKYLNKVKQVGFDTETRPSFQKNHRYKVSLVQISTLEEECFLFRLKEIGSLDGLFAFLENEKVQKIGLSLKDDFHSLSKLGEFTPAGFVELQTFVKAYDIADNSLQKIYGLVFNERISKTQRLTNWEAKDLTPGQQAYAAIDAWACQRIYNHLMAGGFDPEGCPYTIDDETAQALQRSVGIHLPQFETSASETVPPAAPARKKRRKKKSAAEAGMAVGVSVGDAENMVPVAKDDDTGAKPKKRRAKRKAEADTEAVSQEPSGVAVSEPVAAAPVKKSRYKTHSEEISQIKERLTVMEAMISELKETIVALLTPKKTRKRKGDK